MQCLCQPSFSPDDDAQIIRVSCVTYSIQARGIRHSRKRAVYRSVGERKSGRGIHARSFKTPPLR